MALISVSCRVEIGVKVQVSEGMGFQLKLDPTMAVGLDESLHEGKWCFLGITNARIVLESLFEFGILGALELSSLFESKQTEC